MALSSWTMLPDERGRPADYEMSQCFDKLCQWLEEADELCSLEELHLKLVSMQETARMHTPKNNSREKLLTDTATTFFLRCSRQKKCSMFP